MSQILILGGGISACWTFSVLSSLGFNPILISKGKLGGEQTLASQGMIHGGQRYSLQGVLHKHTKGISEMPEIWESCFKGENVPDLSAVRLLSEKQYLWSAGGLASSVTAFFASKAMNTKVNSVKQDKLPEIFQNPSFKGSIYELPEVVVDALSLVEALVSKYKERIIIGEEVNITTQNESIISVEVDNKIKFTNPLFVVSAAGKGNEAVVNKLFPNKRLTQSRPLKQILIKDLDCPLYAHCITTDPRPRVTVSAHPIANGKYVWYLGGLVGVFGIDKSDDEALSFAFKEMTTLFPWINWKEKEWATLSVDRAEPYSATGLLPDGPGVKEFSNGAIVWPTKLTFAPAVAELVLKLLEKGGIRSENISDDKDLLKNNSRQIEYNQYPWEHVAWKKL